MQSYGIFHELKTFLEDEEAQGAAEYIIILSVITIAAYGLIKMFSGAWAVKYNTLKEGRTGVKGMLP